MSLITEWGAWWKNWHIIQYYFAEYVFDTYIDPESALIQKFKFSIGFENVVKLESNLPVCSADFHGRFKNQNSG